ncbi:unnamed protein product [Notodromas monacha]|uniref:Uncharacterized protein n=1 Tax=Notodromas monacha TaxID=399045 RepID=A0A7R9BWC8_9CRUS|nr:unnamed protein product [Notodromas monacha]CAG0921448.1 unnamed protein product [Notodromas monacha]
MIDKKAVEEQRLPDSLSFLRRGRVETVVRNGVSSPTRSDGGGSSPTTAVKERQRMMRSSNSPAASSASSDSSFDSSNGSLGQNPGGEKFADFTCKPDAVVKVVTGPNGQILKPARKAPPVPKQPAPQPVRSSPRTMKKNVKFASPDARPVISAPLLVTSGAPDIPPPPPSCPPPEDEDPEASPSPNPEAPVEPLPTPGPPSPKRLDRPASLAARLFDRERSGSPSSGTSEKRFSGLSGRLSTFLNGAPQTLVANIARTQSHRQVGKEFGRLFASFRGSGDVGSDVAETDAADVESGKSGKNHNKCSTLPKNNRFKNHPGLRGSEERRNLRTLEISAPIPQKVDVNVKTVPVQSYREPASEEPKTVDDEKKKSRNSWSPSHAVVKPTSDAAPATIVSIKPRPQSHVGKSDFPTNTSTKLESINEVPGTGNPESENIRKSIDNKQAKMEAPRFGSGRRPHSVASPSPSPVPPHRPSSPPPPRPPPKPQEEIEAKNKKEATSVKPTAENVCAQKPKPEIAAKPKLAVVPPLSTTLNQNQVRLGKMTVELPSSTTSNKTEPAKPGTTWSSSSILGGRGPLLTSSALKEASQNLKPSIIGTAKPTTTSPGYFPQSISKPLIPSVRTTDMTGSDVQIALGARPSSPAGATRPTSFTPAQKTSFSTFKPSAASVTTKPTAKSPTSPSKIPISLSHGVGNPLGRDKNFSSMSSLASNCSNASSNASSSGGSANSGNKPVIGAKPTSIPRPGSAARRSTSPHVTATVHGKYDRNKAQQHAKASSKIPTLSPTKEHPPT